MALWAGGGSGTGLTAAATAGLSPGFAPALLDKGDADEEEADCGVTAADPTEVARETGADVFADASIAR